MIKAREFKHIFVNNGHKEHIHSSQKIKEKNLLIIRCISLIINIVITMNGIYVMHYPYFGRFFTQWGLSLVILTFLFFLLSYITSKHVDTNPLLQTTPWYIYIYIYIGANEQGS